MWLVSFLFSCTGCTLVHNIQSPSIALKNPSYSSTSFPSLYLPHILPPTRFVFAHNCHESGLISETEWSIYCDWHSFLLDALPLKFDGIVYLKTDPKVGQETWEKKEGELRKGRVQRREEGRGAERGEGASAERKVRNKVGKGVEREGEE